VRHNLLFIGFQWLIRAFFSLKETALPQYMCQAIARQALRGQSHLMQPFFADGGVYIVGGTAKTAFRLELDASIQDGAA
jgi:hypothetical protein